MKITGRAGLGDDRHGQEQLRKKVQNTVNQGIAWKW